MIVKKISPTKGKRVEGGSLPDIDCDFSSEDRATIKAYMESRFGQSQVCSIGSYTTFQLKGAIKDLDRQVNSSYTEANIITSIIDKDDSTMIDLYKRAAKEPKLKEYIKTNSDVFHMIPSLLEQKKSESIHPCALVIFPKVLNGYEFTPLRKQKGLLVSYWDGAEMEKAGFLKEDILGIAQLTKFTDILRLIEENGKKVPEIYNLPFDKEVYRFFCNGWNSDVFQFHTESMTSFMKNLKPRRFDDLVATTALMRPGPMGMGYHEKYIKYKNEGAQPKYLWGTEEITKNTYGILTYQEQIMQVCQQLGGLTEAEADDVRSALGKKNIKKAEPLKVKIREGYLERGATEEDFNHTWDVFVEFAKYSFNLSHSVAYSKIGYICQYLKVNYPIEFWTTALRHSNEDKKLIYLSEIFQTGLIKVSPPDINESDINMRSDMDTNTIYWGLESIKGIGDVAANQIIENREKNGDYISFDDFLQRHSFKGSKVNKRNIESLITCGAFDKFHNFEGFEEKRMSLIEKYRSISKKKVANPDRDIYTVGATYENYFWKLHQKRLTGLAFIDYDEMCLSKGIETRYIEKSELTKNHTYPIFRAFGGYVSECKVRSGAKGKFAIISFESNYKMFKLMVWSDEFYLIKDKLKGIEKSFIVFDAHIKYDDKWTKGNQFTLTKESQIEILN